MNANIILIGMPGSGKSTVGQALANKIQRQWLDTDALIETQQQRRLQDIVDTEGYLALREIEAQCLMALDCQNHIISTGGSAVYSAEAMQHLRTIGTVFYLALPYSVIEQRINNFSERGLARKQGQSLNDLFIERKALYEHHAQHTIICEGLEVSEICKEIIKTTKN